MPHQAKARCVGIGQVSLQRRRRRARLPQQLAFVETPLGIDPRLVLGERAQFFVRQKRQLGDTNAVLARDHTIERTRQRHDAFDGTVRRLQHFVVIAVDGDVGVHIAVAGVHVQRGPDPALEHALVHSIALAQDGLESAAAKNVLQRCAQLCLPAGTQAVVLQLGKQRIHIAQPERPQTAHLGDQGQGLRHAVFQQFGRRNLTGVVVLANRQMAAGKEIFEFVAQRNLVAQAQLNVDALNAVGVFGHARQRDHHVFVDLEGVGVLADGRRTLAIKPELLARIGADGDKAFAAARVGDAHHFRGGARHGVGVITGNVAKQHHLGQAAAFGFGGVTNGPQIAVIQMLQPRQQHATALGLGKHEVLDFHNAGNGVARMAEEFQANRSHMAGHAVHDPARAGDQAVAAFFLDTRQAAEEFVGDVLAQAFLAERRARDVESFRAQQRLAVGLEILELETGQRRVMNLAQVVPQARHFQPLGLRRHHAPTGQVVQRRAPQHRFLAAGVHGDVAADARGFGRGRVHRKNKTTALGRV